VGRQREAAFINVVLRYSRPYLSKHGIGQFLQRHLFSSFTLTPILQVDSTDFIRWRQFLLTHRRKKSLHPMVLMLSISYLPPFSLSLCLFLCHTHTHTHARTPYPSLPLLWLLSSVVNVYHYSLLQCRQEYFVSYRLYKTA
jgi:hypothetical protein